LGLNLGHPIVTNGVFEMRHFPNYFGQYLLIAFDETIHKQQDT